MDVVQALRLLGSWWFRLPVVASLALWLSGCPASSPPACRSNADCTESGTQCVGGRCVRVDGGAARDAARDAPAEDAPLADAPWEAARDASEADARDEEAPPPGERAACRLPIGPSAGGGTTSSPSYRAYVRVGTPLPSGAASSPNYTVCLRP